MIEIISGLNTAIDLVKRLRELNDKIQSADIKMLIADLSEQLAEAKISIAELLEKNLKLEEEIKSLKEKKKEELVFKNGAYYSVNDDGPFCPGCYDKQKSKSRLIRNTGFEIMGNYRCSVCGKPCSVK